MGWRQSGSSASSKLCLAGLSQYCGEPRWSRLTLMQKPARPKRHVSNFIPSLGTESFNPETKGRCSLLLLAILTCILAIVHWGCRPQHGSARSSEPWRFFARPVRDLCDEQSEGSSIILKPHHFGRPENWPGPGNRDFRLMLRAFRWLRLSLSEDMVLGRGGAGTGSAWVKEA